MKFPGLGLLGTLKGFTKWISSEDAHDLLTSTQAKTNRSSLNQIHAIPLTHNVVLEKARFGGTLSLIKIIARIILIAAGTGLLVFISIELRWGFAFSSLCVVSAGIGNHLYRKNELRKAQAQHNVAALPLALCAIQDSNQAKAQATNRATIERVTEWAKLGRRITPPRQMEEGKRQFLPWLRMQTDQDVQDLFVTVPQKMVNLVENFPEIFAEVCVPRQIALIATHLYRAGIDCQGVAISTLMQCVYNKVEAFSKTAANEQFYNLLLVFADAGLFHPALESQLTAIKRKIVLDLPKEQRTPTQLLEAIHANIRKAQAERDLNANATLFEPPVSDKRKREIIQFADELILEPRGKDFPRRQFLSVMAKQAKKAEIPFLVEFLGANNLVKLWIFEANVDNRSNDPTMRLMQMCGALTGEQFVRSLSMDVFHHVIGRCPWAALGLDLARLKNLADSRKCDRPLFALARLLDADQNLKKSYKEKREVLAEVVIRVESSNAEEAARQRALAPPVDISELIENLRATMDPVEIGEMIDRMSDEQLTAFISLLGEGVKLDIFWAIQEKKIFAQSMTQKQKERLQRIYPKLSHAQMVFSAKTEGLKVVLSNTEDKYIEAAVAVLSLEQLRIVASNQEMVWFLGNLVLRLDFTNTNTFSKLLVIAQTVPSLIEMRTPEHQAALIQLSDIVKVRSSKLIEPPEGWGSNLNVHHAIKHLDELFASKISCSV